MLGYKEEDAIPLCYKGTSSRLRPRETFLAGSKKEARQVKRHTLTAVPLTVGSPELGAPTLTVGQIVEQLGPVAPDRRPP